MQSAPYSVIVAEDQIPQRDIILSLCEKHGLHVAAATSSGKRLVSEALTHKPDIILLDIGLEKMDGISAYKAILQSGLSPQMIFVTASLNVEHLLIGINELGSVAYLTKPVMEDQFNRAIAKAIRNIQNEQLVQSVNIKPIRWINVKNHKRDISINEDSIVYVEKVEKRLIKIYLSDKRCIESTSNMNEIFEQATEHIFSPHRSYLVNVNYITSVTPDHFIFGNYKITLSHSPTVIPLTKRQYCHYVKAKEKQLHIS
jgi:DNA-binding LytR/AlgR family response regulator